MSIYIPNLLTKCNCQNIHLVAPLKSDVIIVCINNNTIWLHEKDLSGVGIWGPQGPGPPSLQQG